MSFPENTQPSWKSYMTTLNPADMVASTTVAAAIGSKIDATNGQSSGLQIQSGIIDAQTTIAASYATAVTRSLAQKVGELADVRDWGVVSDSAGTSTSTIDKNTEALLSAIADTAGNARLHIPASLSIFVNPMIIPTSNFNLVHDGIIILAPNSAASSSVRANLMDFQGSKWSVTGSGTFDGNRANQSWSVGQVVGGLTSNSYSTSDTWLLDPGSNAVAISDFFIDGVTIQNVGNWPVSFGYATRGILSKIKMLNSGNSPQFFAGATDCHVLDSYSSGITDAAFSLYAGTTRCSIIGGTGYKCNQGFGSYCEDDTRTANVDALVANSTTIECIDGSIGFTTGGTVTKLTQIRPTAINNRSINDGTGGASGISCWGAVGAQDVTYIGNRQSGFGTSAASGSTVNLAYFDGTTTGLVMQDNFASSAGSSAANANGIYVNGTQSAVLAGNTIHDSAGTQKYGIGGTMGAAGVVAPNYMIGTMPNGNFMELSFADDTAVLGQRVNGGPVQYSVGVEVTGGAISATSGVFAAAGTNQSTATQINTQYSQVTSGTGGVILPATGTGTEYTISNSTTGTINLYPPVGSTINGNSVNIALEIVAGSCVKVVQMAASNWVKTSST